MRSGVRRLPCSDLHTSCQALPTCSAVCTDSTPCCQLLVLISCPHSLMHFLQDLRNVFEGLMAANHAAVAPGKAVNSCAIQPGSPASAVLQLRCSVEASNCLAFDGLVWNGTVLKVCVVVFCFHAYTCGDGHVSMLQLKLHHVISTTLHTWLCRVAETSHRASTVRLLLCAVRHCNCMLNTVLKLTKGTSLVVAG